MTDTPYVPTLNDIYAKNTIYISPAQQHYGFLIRVNHPEIHPHYIRFKEEMKIPPWCPLENAERHAFERMILCSYYPVKLKRT